MTSSSREIDILLVDDNRHFLKAMRSLLLDVCGHQINTIQEAYNGREALQMINDNHYHLVFMDIDMPEMDGITLTCMLDREHLRLTIVALSFHDDSEFQEKMIYAGARYYISKDRLTPEILIEIFERYVLN